jgi:HIRAN domain
MQPHRGFSFAILRSPGASAQEEGTSDCRGVRRLQIGPRWAQNPAREPRSVVQPETHELRLPWGEWEHSVRGFYVRRLERQRADRAGCAVFEVALTHVHANHLQLPAFAPGQALQARPEPENQNDPNAIAIYDAPGQFRVGYVPRESIEVVRRAMTLGPVQAMCLWEEITAEERVRIGAVVAPCPIHVVEDETWGSRFVQVALGDEMEPGTGSRW